MFNINTSGGSGAIRILCKQIALPRLPTDSRFYLPDLLNSLKLFCRRTGADQRIRVTCLDYFLTDLTINQLPLELLLPTYYHRSTIERYFYDENYALGVRQIHTHHFPGAALLQFLVATGWIVELPSRHYLLKKLLRHWNSLELMIEDSQPDLNMLTLQAGGG